MTKFYLGTHVLNHIDKTNIPLFVSFRQLRSRKLKRFNHNTPICVDSGGFSELNLFGKWTITHKEYDNKLKQLKTLGLKIDWAAQQDWMCEPFVIDKTGLDIETHQKLTVDNYIKLNSLNSDVDYIPVIQGYELDDYLSHIDQFYDNDIDLSNERIVGVGSVCRRQSSDEIKDIIKEISKKGINIHGFGVKTNGLKKYKQYMNSCDSLAWSFSARKLKEKCFKCQNKNIKNCANCLNYALKWRSNLFNKIDGLV